jgi:hypothetical protein
MRCTMARTNFFQWLAVDQATGDVGLLFDDRRGDPEIAAYDGRVYGIWAEKPEQDGDAEARGTVLRVGIADFRGAAGR